MAPLISRQNTLFGALQAGNVFVSYLSCYLQLTFASQVFSFVPDMSSAKSAANNTVDLLDSIPEIDAAQSEGKKPDNVKGHIRFEDVHFRYPTRPGIRVLRGLNLDVKPSTYIALVGASGCGKSTMYVAVYCIDSRALSTCTCSIQLVERFYDSLAGHIYVGNLPSVHSTGLWFLLKLDDQLISDFNVQEYRKNISLVSQEPVCGALVLCISAYTHG
jgi:ATP-binding cassette, subfamily B (MDR/TAP), member 1